MELVGNSWSARDVASLIHPNSDLRAHRSVGASIMDRGAGVRVFDEDGRDYIECMSGLWCASLGFRNERLARAAYDQLMKLGFYHIYGHNSTEPAIALSEKLLQVSPVPMSKVLFQCSGSEANETAIKLCWYHHHASGNPQRRIIIGRKAGYHGSTTGSASLSFKPNTHTDFGLPYEPFRHTEFPHYYRFHEDGETEDGFATRMADALEALILKEGPENVAAFFAEPIIGSGGGVMPPASYFEKVQTILRRYDILFVADEVICGFGRTGNWWGSQTFDLRPDIITCAKALSAGMLPISAVLVNDRIYDSMLNQSDRLGSFAHGSTFGGMPAPAAVALEAISIMEEDDIVQHARDVGAFMLRELEPLNDHPMIDDLRGTGLMISMEIVADKRTRANFPEERKVVARLDRHCRANGVILKLANDRVVFTPPLIITEEEAREAVGRFRRALDATLAELKCD